MSGTDLLQALALLAAILGTFIGPIVWMNVRSGRSREAAAAVASKYALAPLPAPHRRMAVFSGEVDGLRMEVAAHANVFDRQTREPFRYGASRSLMIRLWRPAPLRAAFVIDNARSPEQDLDPATFQLHAKWRLHSTNPAWLGRLLNPPEIRDALNAFAEASAARPFCLVRLDEHGICASYPDPTPASALALAGEVLKLAKRIEQRTAFMP